LAKTILVSDRSPDSDSDDVVVVPDRRQLVTGSHVDRDTKRTADKDNSGRPKEHTGRGQNRQSEAHQRPQEQDRRRAGGQLEEEKRPRVPGDREEAGRKKSSPPGSEKTRRRVKSRGTRQLERSWSSR
jgi:hypothetical protein